MVSDLAYEPANPWLLVPHPWVTRDLIYRHDLLERRIAAMYAILRWEKGSDLHFYARLELDRLDDVREAWDRDIDTLAAAYCSWPA